MRRKNFILTAVTCMLILTCAATLVIAAQHYSRLATPSPNRDPLSNTDPAPNVTYTYSIQTPFMERDDLGAKRYYPIFSIDQNANSLPAGVAVRATKLLNAKVDELITEFEQSGKTAGYDTPGHQQWDINISARTDIRNDWLLTVSFLVNESFGGENDQVPSALTIDMRNGSLVTIDSIFKGGSGPVLLSRSREALIAWIESKNQYSHTVQTADQVVAPDDDVAYIYAHDGWYPDIDGLHLQVASGLISIVADGAQDVVLPWGQLGDIVSPFTRMSWISPAMTGADSPARPVLNSCGSMSPTDAGGIPIPPTWLKAATEVHNAACVHDYSDLQRLMDDPFSIASLEASPASIIADWRSVSPDGKNLDVLARLLEVRPTVDQGGCTYQAGGSSAVFARLTHHAPWTEFIDTNQQTPN